MVAVVPRAVHAFSVLALGWYVSRLQRFCRFAARGTGTFDSARSSMAQLSMGDRLLPGGFFCVFLFDKPWWWVIVVSV